MSSDWLCVSRGSGLLIGRDTVYGGGCNPLHTLCRLSTLVFPHKSYRTRVVKSSLDIQSTHTHTHTYYVDTFSPHTDLHTLIISALQCARHFIHFVENFIFSR